MDFETLLHVAKRNETSKKEPVRWLPTKFKPPTKEQREKDKVLSEGVQKFLARKEEEDKRKKLEAEKRKEELMALRAKDPKANKRVQTMLKRTKSANRSVMEDAVDNNNTADTLSGPLQPDEDDYGFVSECSSALYNKLIEKMYSTPSDDQPNFAPKKKPSASNLLSTKERVKMALLKEKEEELLPRSRKRKHKDTKKEGDEDDAELDFSAPDRDYKSEKSEREKEKEKEKEEKPKPKRPPAPPPINFNDLLKIAAQKQHEPVVIETKKVQEPEQLMTKKQRLEHEKMQEYRRRRLERENEGKDDKKKPKSSQSSVSDQKPGGMPRIPKLNRNEDDERENSSASDREEKKIGKIPKLNSSSLEQKTIRRIPKLKRTEDESSDKRKSNELRQEKERSKENVNRTYKDERKDKTLDNNKQNMYKDRIEEKSRIQSDKRVLDRNKMIEREKLEKEKKAKQKSNEEDEFERLKRERDEALRVLEEKEKLIRERDEAMRRLKEKEQLIKERDEAMRKLKMYEDQDREMAAKNKKPEVKISKAPETKQPVKVPVKSNNSNASSNNKPVSKPDNLQKLTEEQKKKLLMKNGKVISSSVVKEFPPKDLQKNGVRQFPPKDLLPKNGVREFPPKDLQRRDVQNRPGSSNMSQRSKQFPPADVRRKAVPSKKRRIEDSDEYDSELEDFIDDGPEESLGREDVSKMISEIFKYDRNKYSRYDDDECMESNYAQISKEEFISAKCGLLEDLEDMQREKEELARKKKKVTR